MVLSHDITKIVPGRFKGPAFRRGQVIRQEDVNRLRDLGKETITALDLAPGWLHEDDAALRLATAAFGWCIQQNAFTGGSCRKPASRFAASSSCNQPAAISNAAMFSLPRSRSWFTSSCRMTWPRLKAGPLNRPGTISVISWPNTIPTASSTGISLTVFPLPLDQQFSWKGQLFQPHTRGYKNGIGYSRCDRW